MSSAPCPDRTRNTLMASRFSRTALTLACTLAVIGLAPSGAVAQQAGLDCTVILDAASGKVLRRDGICDQRFTPASTFKVPLAVIGFDAGILIDAHTPAWDYKPEYKAVKRDRRNVDPTAWEKDSVLWYSRELVRRVGGAAFGDYIARLGYGNADITGDPGKGNGLTHSWLSSSLRISPDEQAAFMRALLLGALPVSAKAQVTTRDILPKFKAEGWVVHGKTGSHWLRDKAYQTDRSRPLGWFVGWADRDGKRIVFARLQIGTRKSDTPSGPKVRDDFLKALPALMAP